MANHPNRSKRAIIKAEAERLDCRYRVTAEGEVHFHGEMPNTNQTGWWLYAQTVDEAVARIRGEIG